MGLNVVNGRFRFSRDCIIWISALHTMYSTSNNIGDGAQESHVLRCGIIYFNICSCVSVFDMSVAPREQKQYIELLRMENIAMEVRD